MCIWGRGPSAPVRPHLLRVSVVRLLLRQHRSTLSLCRVLVLVLVLGERLGPFVINAGVPPRPGSAARAQTSHRVPATGCSTSRVWLCLWLSHLHETLGHLLIVFVPLAPRLLFSTCRYLRFSDYTVWCCALFVLRICIGINFSTFSSKAAQVPIRGVKYQHQHKHRTCPD